MPIDDVAARGFQAGAAAYELARPGYPDAAVALLARELAVGAGTRVCDLAAGTGKLTRRLVELRCRRGRGRARRRHARAAAGSGARPRSDRRHGRVDPAP